MAIPRLGVNIDHIATLRQLRGTTYPSLVEAAHASVRGGAQQITIHLREDRRHIQDRDGAEIKNAIQVPLNLEMALADDIRKYALKLRPKWACLVPEKRQEVTTEGGLDVQKNRKRLVPTIKALQSKGIRISLFIEPDLKAIRMAKDLGADAVEIHTGRFAHKKGKAQEVERDRIFKACQLAKSLGLHPHAGHGLDYQNVRLLLTPGEDLIEEFNIGHSIVCRATEVGLERAVREMVSAISAP